MVKKQTKQREIKAWTQSTNAPEFRSHKNGFTVLGGGPEGVGGGGSLLVGPMEWIALHQKTKQKIYEVPMLNSF